MNISNTEELKKAIIKSEGTIIINCPELADTIMSFKASSYKIIAATIGTAAGTVVGGPVGGAAGGAVGAVIVGAPIMGLINEIGYVATKKLYFKYEYFKENKIVKIVLKK